MLDIKVPFLGRYTASNPFAHEPSGFGAGKIHKDVMGGARPKGHLSIVVMRDQKYMVDGKVVKAKDLRDLTPEQFARKQLIEGSGYAVPAEQVMSWKDRFMNNIRGKALSIDLGTGVVTDIGVLAMANEYAWANPSAAVNTVLALANWHASGTGATAAATTDKKLQTWDSIAAVAGTQSLVASGTAPGYRSVATINYTGTEAVTEWGLHTSGTLSATTGTPFTATTATSATVTGTPYTASTNAVAGQQFQAVFPGTTTVWGLVLTNTTSVLNIPAWYTNAADAAGSTPGATEAFTLRPVMWDHKVFSAVNVNNGDSIQFTYTVTINSGG